MIDKDSRKLLAGLYLAALVISILFYFLVPCPWVKWPVIVLALWFCAWQTWFFRVPRRSCGTTEGSVMSIVDGRVVICEKAYEPEVLRAECWQVSVYMNFFDVHANFWPVSGTVLSYDYHPGAHMFAFEPKSSLKNEHTCVKLEYLGREILFKQVAGGFARRIVCHAAPGQKTVAGAQCGIIKFGSRLDLFLPLDADIKVQKGQIVRACETIIAQM